MKKGDEVTKRVTKEIRFSPIKHRESDEVTKVFDKTLLYIFIFSPLETFRKTLRHRHFVTQGGTR